MQISLNPHDSLCARLFLFSFIHFNPFFIPLYYNYWHQIQIHLISFVFVYGYVCIKYLCKIEFSFYFIASNSALYFVYRNKWRASTYLLKTRFAFFPSSSYHFKTTIFHMRNTNKVSTHHFSFLLWILFSFFFFLFSFLCNWHIHMQHFLHMQKENNNNKKK